MTTHELSIEANDTPGVLSDTLQAIARRYVDARRRSGEALLDAAAALAEARQIASHGEWGVFLEATGTAEATAQQLLTIHRRAIDDPVFADAIRRDHFTPSVAGLLARPSTPATVVDAALQAPVAPTAREVRQAIADARPAREDKSWNVPGFAELFTALQQRASAVGFVLEQRADGYELQRNGERYSLTSDLASVENTLVVFERARQKRQEHESLPTPPAGWGWETDMQRTPIWHRLYRVTDGYATNWHQQPPDVLNEAHMVIGAPPLDPAIRPTLEAQGWRFVGGGFQLGEVVYFIERDGKRLTKVAEGLRAMVSVVPTPLHPALVERLAGHGWTVSDTTWSKDQEYPLYTITDGIESHTKADTGIAALLDQWDEELPIPAPEPSADPGQRAMDIFIARFDAWLRAGSVEAELVWLAVLIPSQRERNESLSRQLWHWLSLNRGTRDWERTLELLGVAEVAEAV